MSKLLSLFLNFTIINLVVSSSDCIAVTPQGGAVVASHLFGIDISNIDVQNPSIGANYTYNRWKDDPGKHKNGKCDAYDGGHSGIDVQTYDVASSRTADRIFYSVSRGIVINDGGDKYNTIAIYDQRQDITSIYLHARRVDVSLGQNIEVGLRLGIQGDSGVKGAEHVHLEFRKGRHTGYACGANDPSSIDPLQIANRYITSFAAQIAQCNKTLLTFPGKCGLLSAAIPSSTESPACPYTYESSYLYECLNLPVKGKVEKVIRLFATPNVNSDVGVIKPGVSITAIDRKRVVAPCSFKVKVTQEYFPNLVYIENGKRVKPYSLKYGKKLYPEIPFNKNTFAPGDTIYLIDQIGEGRSIYWFDGALVQSNDSICTPTKYRNLACWAEPYRHCPRDDYNNLIDSEEWFKVKTNNGVEGWIIITKTNRGAFKWEEQGC